MVVFDVISSQNKFAKTNTAPLLHPLTCPVHHDNNRMPSAHFIACSIKIVQALLIAFAFSSPTILPTETFPEEHRY